ncbi:MAG: NAD-binding protein [Acidobacteriota bacterium]
MPGARTIRSLRRVGLWWRLLVVLMVIALGLAGFASGVELSDREGIPQASWPTKAYYTLGLFVFGGLDLGVPQGGPVWGQALLWLAFFAAPAITTSAVLEGLLLIVQPEAWRLRRLKGHVIIGGCGRLALLYLERLRANNPRLKVVVVELRSEHPQVQAVSERARTQVIYGDISSEAVLASLRLERARRVVLLTGDDYANLDAASRICHREPKLASRIQVHVSDIRLLRVIEQTEILREVVKFNSYRTAARHLVEATLRPHFYLTENIPDTVVLAGFGRFGQTVLDELQQQAAGLFQTVVIIDLDAEHLALVFDEQVGFEPGYRHELVEADVRHPRTWQRVQELIGEPSTLPVTVLGVGLDGVNILTALWLAGKSNDAKIIARCFDQSSFTEQISEECGFEIVSTAELLLASMRPEGFAR